MAKKYQNKGSFVKANHVASDLDSDWKKKLAQWNGATEKKIVPQQQTLSIPTISTQKDVSPESIDPGVDTENAPVIINNMKPQFSTKAAGLSSALYTNDSLIMATPGKKQAIVLTEKYDQYRNYTPEKKNFKTSPIIDKPKFVITQPLYPLPGYAESDAPIALIDDPRGMTSNNRKDLLGFKPVLEKRFFGREFNDNIHIQLIYNILDIDKLLAPYINAIAVSINQMLPKSDTAASGRDEDMIGNFYLGNPYDFVATVDRAGFPWSDNDWNNLLILRKQMDDLFQNPQMSYFGNVLYSQDLKKPKKGSEKGTQKYANNEAEQKKKLYYIYWLISFARMSLAHSKEYRDILFLLDSSPSDEVWNTFKNVFKSSNPPHDIDTAIREARGTLNKIYKAKVNKIDDDFIKNAKVNLSIISKVLNEPISQNLLTEYYVFAKRKDHRNTGYSIRSLRELLIRTNIGTDDSKSHDTIYSAFQNDEDAISSVRQKLNTVLDFIIWRYYTTDAEKDDSTGLPLGHSDREEQFIGKLRGASLSKSNLKTGDVGDILFFSPQEDNAWKRSLETKHKNDCPENRKKLEKEIEAIIAKRDIYRKEAEVIWSALSKNIEQAVTLIKPEFIAEFKGSDDSTFPKVKMQDSDSDHYFSKLMYLLTLFLDGKDINTLLTQLASNFDNIAGYLDILNDLKMKGIIPEDEHPPFMPQYTFFNDSRVIAAELRKVNSIARMTKADQDVATRASIRALYIDATEFLGWDGDEDSLNAFIDEHLVPKKKGGKTGYRNFLANNVINNRRFLYMVRFGRPDDLRKIVGSKALVCFVLDRMPSEQIEKYYINVSATDGKNLKKANKEDMINVLAEKLSMFEASSLADIQTSKNAPREKRPEAERMKALVSLYLTVTYLVVKNLININYRYFLGFHVLERDAELRGVGGIKNDYTKLTQKSLKTPATTSNGKRFQRYFRAYHMENNNQMRQAITQFRNHVEHINIINALCKYYERIETVPSYFGLYHYLMQLWLCGQQEQYDEDKRNPVLNVPDTRRTYCKDMVKLLCYPFGYNLSRYKTLTIEGLFDKNESSEDDTTSPEEPLPKPTTDVPSELYYRSAKALTTDHDIVPAEGMQTTFYAGNKRYSGTLIRLTTNSAVKKRKDGSVPTVYRLDAAAMSNDGAMFYMDDDNAWYVSSIPYKYLTKV